MKTADRVLVGQIYPPFSRDRHPQSAKDWVAGIAATRALIAEGPRLFADNVAAYVNARRPGDGFVLEEFPSLAPPWPSCWIEYPSHSGRQRRGVLVRDVTHALETTREGAGAAAIDDARANGYHGDIGWVLEFELFVEDQRRRIIGPLGWTVLALDPRGRSVGNRWVLGAPRDGEVDEDDEAAQAEDRLIAGLLPAFQTLAFLHCRNVVTEPVPTRPKLDARHRKKHGRPLLRYQAVRLEVPRRSTSGGKGGITGDAALHIVPGNFHHYGDCCPGGHDPHGLLFGKLEGVYWVPSHVRGNPGRGEVRSDFDLQVRS